jgi:hypothetical protein
MKNQIEHCQRCNKLPPFLIHKRLVESQPFSATWEWHMPGKETFKKGLLFLSCFISGMLMASEDRNSDLLAKWKREHQLEE